LQLLKSIGAHQIIDYRQEAFEAVLSRKEVDYVFDTIGKDILMKSIALQPKKIISVHFVETSKMIKTGVKLPSLLKVIMNLSMNKFRKAASKNQVKLIGQVTGADGSLLQKASEFVSSFDFKIKPTKTLALQEVEQTGFSKSDLGKVILFS